MKKLLLSIMALAAVITASAKDYTGSLSVSVAGEVSDQGEATISVEQSDDKYTLTLRNFTFVAGETEIGVGNIEISDVEGVTSDGITTFDADVTATVSEGDEGTTWWGPTLFANGIPVTLQATMTETALNATITMTVMGMDIVVNFGQQGTMKEYTADLNVTVSGMTSDAVEATIEVTESNDKYSFTLRNFKFGTAESEIAVGNIGIFDVEGVTTDGTTVFDTEATATVTDGDDGTTWWGPTLFADGIPVQFQATMTDTELNATITMTVMGMDIVVNFGDLTGIKAPSVSKNNKNAAIYDVAGRQIDSMKQGQTYIIKQTDGTTQKFVCR